jgi:hypothetical protein
VYVVLALFPARTPAADYLGSIQLILLAAMIQQETVQESAYYLLAQALIQVSKAH